MDVRRPNHCHFPLTWCFSCRGDRLYYNYALVVSNLSHLQEVALASLTHILRGSVRIEKNRNLCFVHTVDWTYVTRFPLTENVFKVDSKTAEANEFSFIGQVDKKNIYKMN